METASALPVPPSIDKSDTELGCVWYGLRWLKAVYGSGDAMSGIFLYGKCGRSPGPAGAVRTGACECLMADTLRGSAFPRALGGHE
jgi:hypothetical protein